MFLGEPPRTQADLNFQIFGVPVRVHPFFWLVAALLGIRGNTAEPVTTLIWVLVVFVSILVHELGHALTVRVQGWTPAITLYSLGGFASYRATHETPRGKILISAAGPAAGFTLATVVLVAVRLAGHPVGFIRSTSAIDFDALAVHVDMVQRLHLVVFDIYFSPFAAERLNTLVSDLLQVNILWGLINLLPIYPLDGGQIAREILVEANPSAGIRRSLWLSIATAGGLVVYALTDRSIFMALMFGLLGYANYTTLRAYTGWGNPRRW